MQDSPLPFPYTPTSALSVSDLIVFGPFSLCASPLNPRSATGRATCHSVRNYSDLTGVLTLHYITLNFL